jgi:hypothetical protein
LRKKSREQKIAARGSALGLWRRKSGDDAIATATLAPHRENQPGPGKIARLERRIGEGETRKSNSKTPALKSKNQSKIGRTKASHKM